MSVRNNISYHISYPQTALKQTWNLTNCLFLINTTKFTVQTPWLCDIVLIRNFIITGIERENSITVQRIPQFISSFLTWFLLISERSSCSSLLHLDCRLLWEQELLNWLLLSCLYECRDRSAASTVIPPAGSGSFSATRLMGSWVQTLHPSIYLFVFVYTYKL